MHFHDERDKVVQVVCDKALPMIRFLRRDLIFHRLLANSSWLFGSNLVVTGIGFVQTVLIARSLEVEGYGILTAVIAFVGLVNQFVDFRVWETVVKYLSEFWVRGEKPKALALIKMAYLIDASSGVVAFMLVLLLAPLSARYVIRQPGSETLINLFATSLLLSTINNTSSAILRVFNRFSWLSIHSGSIAILKLGLVALFLWWDGGLTGILLAYLVSACLEAILMTGMAWKVVWSKLGDIRGAVPINVLRPYRDEMFRFLFATNINSVMRMLNTKVDVLVLSYFWSPLEVGYYKMAQTFARTLLLASDPIYTSIYPELSRLWAASNHRGFARLIKQTTMTLLVLFIPATMLLTLSSPKLLGLIVGPEFAPSASPLRWLAAGYLLAIVTLWAHPAALSMSRADISTKALALGSTVQVLMLMSLTPRWGANGPAISLLGLYLAWWAVIAIGLKHNFAKVAKIASSQ